MTVSVLSRRGLTRTVQSLAKDVRPLQQADGVDLARCGGEGEEVVHGEVLFGYAT